MKNNGRHNNNTNDNTTNPLCLLAANLLGHSLALLIFFIVFRLLLNNLLNNLAILCLHYATLHYTTLVVTTGFSKHCLPGCDLSFAWISTVSYTSLLRPNLVCWIGPSWDFSVGHFSQTFYSLQLHSSSKVYRNSRASIPSGRLYWRCTNSLQFDQSYQ